MTPTPLPFSEVRREINGVELEFARAGPSGGPLVILLHGFPDLWQGWHYQIGPLAAAGFRVLVPNQRGYGRSSKPGSVGDYDLDRLAEDIIALADAEGHQSFRLVGHDWGGIVAWWTAAWFPRRVAQLAVLNAPHPAAFWRYASRSPTQFVRSWYVGLFQLPWLPEAILSFNNFQMLFNAMCQASRPGTFDETDRSYLTAGWAVPGSLTAMLNYYRALLRRSRRTLSMDIMVPTLILTGEQDPTEEPGLATTSAEFCQAVQITRFDQAWHWIQREEPQRVTGELLRFLESRRDAG